MKQVLTWMAITVVAALVFSITGCSSDVEEVHPQMKKLTSAVYASGALVPEQEYKVVSTVDGYLEEVYVHEGDTVREGQQLFYISNQVRTAQEQGAAAVVQKTIPTVSDNAPVYQELEGRIEVARIKMEQDELQYNRYKKIYDQDAISQSAYEKYYLQYQSSLKDYQNLKQQYEQQKLSGKLQLQQAQNQLEVNRAQQTVGRLKSFMNGVVYEIYKKQGDLISPTQPVALIGAGDMIAKLSVDEDDLDKVYVGQEVMITMDAYDDKVFKASIKKIYPFLNKVEQSFRVDATFDEQLPVGIYGLNLEANIVLTKNKEVLVIPRNALLKGDSVMVKMDGEAKRVKITTGIADDEWVEVKEGLGKDATIIIE